MIIPAWQYRLAVETQEAVQDDGPVRVWLRTVIKWHWGILGIPPLIVWIIGSGYLMYHVWKTHPDDSSRKKALWTIVLVIPVIGWLLYGQFYGESQEQEKWIKL